MSQITRSSPTLLSGKLSALLVAGEESWPQRGETVQNIQCKASVLRNTQQLTCIRILITKSTVSVIQPFSIRSSTVTTALLPSDNDSSCQK